jgi:hypothetical protein
MTKIKGYDNYFIDDNMNVISTKKNNPKTLKFFKRDNGYLQVMLCSKGKIRTHKVHRLIAETFIPNPDNKPQINHINGIKDDNRIDNLEWVSSSENIQHAYDIGLRIPRKGVDINTSRLIENEVLEIRHLLKEGLSMNKISKIYKVSPCAIFDFKHNITWKHVK